MPKVLGLRWAAVVAGAAILLVVATGCTREIEVPGETVVVEKEVVKEVQVPGETVVVEKEVVKEVQVPGETVVVEKEVVKEVQVPGETVVVEKEVIKTVEVPGETVVVEKEVIKTVEVPGETVVVEKIIVATPAPMAEVGFVLRAAQANPKRGGVVKTAWGATAANFDLHAGGPSWVMGIAYNSLIRKNPNDGLNSVIPSLAVDWEFDPQGLGWTFQLREGVKWHDGTDFSAEDVKATFDRIIDPPQGIVMSPRSLFETVSNVETIDRLTVRFTLSEPRSWMFDLFNHWGVGTHMNIYSKKSLEENGFDLRRVEIAPGTGPFILKEHLAAERWVWEANPDYWNPDLPYVDGVTNLHVPSGEDRGTAVITGIADFTWNTGTAAWNEAKKRSNIGAAKLANFGTIQTLWNPNKEPFNDVRMRRALFLSVNRHDFSKIYSSFAAVNPSRWMSPAGEGAVSPEELMTIPGYRVDNTEDIEEAKRLMAEVGYPNGEGLPTFDLVSSAGPTSLDTIGPFLVDQFSQIGIKVKLRGVERSLVPEEFKKDFDLVTNTSFHSPTVNHTPLWLIQWTTNASQNLNGYSNPEFDEVVAGLNKALTPVERAPLFRQGEDLLDQDPPQIVHGFTDHLPVWQDYVKGINIELRRFTEWGRFETVWIDR